jgi:hypothetical protein
MKSIEITCSWTICPSLCPSSMRVVLSHVFIIIETPPPFPLLLPIGLVGRVERTHFSLSWMRESVKRKGQVTGADIAFPSEFTECSASVGAVMGVHPGADACGVGLYRRGVAGWQSTEGRASRRTRPGIPSVPAPLPPFSAPPRLLPSPAPSSCPPAHRLAGRRSVLPCGGSLKEFFSTLCSTAFLVGRSTHPVAIQGMLSQFQTASLLPPPLNSAAGGNICATCPVPGC